MIPIGGDIYLKRHHKGIKKQKIDAKYTTMQTVVLI